MTIGFSPETLTPAFNLTVQRGVGVLDGRQLVEPDQSRIYLRIFDENGNSDAFYAPFEMSADFQGLVVNGADQETGIMLFRDMGTTVGSAWFAFSSLGASLQVWEITYKPRFIGNTFSGDPRDV